MFHALEQLAETSGPPRGSRVPEDLLAAVGRLDVVLVERHMPELAPTRPREVIEVDGLAAIVEQGGRVLALMTDAAWRKRPPGCPWRRPAGAGAGPIPVTAPQHPPRSFLRLPKPGMRADE